MFKTLQLLLRWVENSSRKLVTVCANSTVGHSNGNANTSNRIETHDESCPFCYTQLHIFIATPYDDTSPIYKAAVRTHRAVLIDLEKSHHGPLLIFPSRIDARRLRPGENLSHRCAPESQTRESDGLLHQDLGLHCCGCTQSPDFKCLPMCHALSEPHQRHHGG